MPLYTFRAIANGLHTDHPVPDLPFVDDSHIPVEDPEAVEATGRHAGTDMWGRFDPVRRFGGWVAFTTDPVRHDLGWVVRWHPDHGRSVLLYRDDEVASVYEDFQGPALLFRAGGYWWDGTTWYRPDQVWDAAGEDWYHRPVPAAATVTAADMLATAAADANRGQVRAIGAAGPDMAPSGRWRDHLARWARERPAGSLRDSVVNLTAPELAADQMVGAAELAGIGGIAASTLRAYIARSEADVPAPQASPTGRSLWARPVAEDWAEARQRSPEGIALAVSAERDTGRLPPGLDDLWSRFSGSFYTRLWERPAVRKRWALRWRTETAVREVADDLGWLVASSLDRIIPVQALSFTIQRAVLDELAEGQQLDKDDPASLQYGINRKVAMMLSWLIRHDPARAANAIGAITGEAEQRLRIPRQVTERSIRVALSLDSNLDADTQRKFLSVVLTPARTTQPPEGTR
jgi:hypothetical protein